MSLLDGPGGRGDDPRMRARFSLVVLAALSILTAGCWPYAAPPGAAPLRYRDAIFTGVTRTNGLTYGSAINQLGQNQTLTFDLYTPTGDTNTSRPAIVWVHGGSFAFGDSSSPGARRRGDDDGHEGLREHLDQLPARTIARMRGIQPDDPVPPGHRRRPA